MRGMFAKRCWESSTGPAEDVGEDSSVAMRTFVLRGTVWQRKGRRDPHAPSRKSMINNLNIILQVSSSWMCSVV